MRKLNLGAGNTEIEGYENIDRKTGQEVYPLECDDESIDEIRASHVLEHFSHRETADVINDWARVLKPGGVLKIAVPDLHAICAAVASGSPINAEGYLMGGHVDENDHHGATFTMAKLGQLFYDAGLDRVRTWTDETTDCSSLPISLNLMAHKPAAPIGSMEFSGVTFVLPTPRYGPSEHHRCIYDALSAFGARVRNISGCFWNQHLCNAIEDEIVNDECRYICTLDYDSLFSVEDVSELYRIMETHPHIDALVPLQSGRGGGNKPLFTMGDPPKAQMPAATFESLTAEISTGHFGLTFIRAEKLREFPKPWMVGTPDVDGGWREGHIDPDIFFWRKWTAEGHHVHLANKVVIGHIEDMVMWPSKDFTPCYQRVTDYITGGKPLEAR